MCWQIVLHTNVSMSLIALTDVFLPADPDQDKHDKQSPPGQRRRYHRGDPLPFQHALAWLSTPAKLQPPPSLCPQRPGRETKQSQIRGQQQERQFKHSPACIVLLYLQLQQSLPSQSLTGGTFPLTQLLFVLLYPAMKTL